MDLDLEGTGIGPAALRRYLEEQVDSLPGTDRHREAFTVLLTGSRAVGEFGPKSDVDIDVLCPQPVYDSVHAASRAAGIIDSPTSFFRTLKGDDWDRYHGRQMGRPHFALTPLETAERQIARFDDVPLWIWTNARILIDPNDQFRRIVEGFHGYPRAVLIKKVKYRWLMAAYWEVECYPHHHGEEAEALLPAATAVLNAVNELLRFFFLVEARPFPYTEKLMPYAAGTKLGRRYCGMLRNVAGLAIGTAGQELPAWGRLDRAMEILCCCDISQQADEFERACQEAMMDAGVDTDWVKADFQNIEELLSGELGPVP